MKSANLRRIPQPPDGIQGAEGSRPIDILARTEYKDVVLQLDVGTCVRVGVDPVAWINKNRGRFPVIHLQDLFNPRPAKVTG